jgi:sulfoxide reductase heme-binding subunit YedZ
MNPIVQNTNRFLRLVPVWPGYVLGFVPAAWLLWLGIDGRLGADPVKALEQELGLIALQLVLVSLLVSPILHLTRINLIRFRRLIGLMAFYYAVMHFAVYLLLDLQLNWGELFKDVTKRPYIILGTLALLLLVPAALTSNDWSVRKLGAAGWQRVHKLVYPASILAAVHFVWLVKAWPLEPLLYLAGMVFLVAYRPLRRHFKDRRRQAMA